jgi:hypothetical protein
MAPRTVFLSSQLLNVGGDVPPNCWGGYGGSRPRPFVVLILKRAARSSPETSSLASWHTVAGGDRRRSGPHEADHKMASEQPRTGRAKRVRVFSQRTSLAVGNRAFADALVRPDLPKTHIQPPAKRTISIPRPGGGILYPAVSLC